jgi:hypothetical protein
MNGLGKQVAIYRRKLCVDERVQAVGYVKGILHDSSIRGEASLAIRDH